METMLPKAVVVHAGARDDYEIAKALSEIGALERLVTNAYLPAPAADQSGPLIPWRSVSLSAKALLAYCAMRARLKPNLHAFSDNALGTKARSIAYRRGSAVFSYSHYAAAAFAPGSQQPHFRFLFQFHPHAKAVRQLLTEERERVPQASFSLNREGELALPRDKVEALEQEAHLANGWVTASSYTASTLISAGIDGGRIHIVPYGVDGKIYSRRHTGPTTSDPFTVYFLGSLSQRKGLYDLLEAITLLKTRNVRLLLRGRGSVDWRLLSEYRHLNIDVQIGLSTDKIVAELHQADLFAMPSLVEGFGHSILQAMSCGVPVVTTRNTCGADIIQPGKSGFLVPIRAPNAIASIIEEACCNRERLYGMGMAAADCARTYTWALFRQGIQSAYSRMCADNVAAEEHYSHGNTDTQVARQR